MLELIAIVEHWSTTWHVYWYHYTRWHKGISLAWQLPWSLITHNHKTQQHSTKPEIIRHQTSHSIDIIEIIQMTFAWRRLINVHLNSRLNLLLFPIVYSVYQDAHLL